MSAVATPRRVAVSLAVAALLAGPTVLAFFSGGYFDSPRAVAGVVAWLLVAVGALAGGTAAVRNRPGGLTVVALALLAGWTLLSTIWAPIAGNAYHGGQLAVLYAGAVIAAALLLGERRVGPWVEPALALGALVVVGYGISERLLPGVLSFSRSLTAQGRLEQPLTYWNAMGELAALGFVLATRVAAERTRPLALRLSAIAATVPLGLGVYLSFSRGALFAALAGCLALAVLSPERAMARTLLTSVLGAIVICAVAAPSGGITGLHGGLSTREAQGAITLLALAVVITIVVFVHAHASRRETGAAVLRLPPRAGWIATALVCAGLAVAMVAGAKEKAGVPLGAGTTRLATLQSNRYDYWRVALRAFSAEPLHGVGAENWSVYWLRDRTISEFATDAHSLELQTLAELGVVGAALLLAFFAGVGLSARAAYRRLPAAATGPTAGFIVWLAHSPLDWDWQMPALSLVAMILVGRIVALAGAETPSTSNEPLARSGPARSHTAIGA